MSAQKGEWYDLTKKQQVVAKWRYERRKELRNMYLKEILNPIRQVMPMDDAVMRHSQIRLQSEYLMKVKVIPHLIYTMGLAGFVFLSVQYVSRSKAKEEEIYRRGEVPYRDRDHKFT